MDFSIYLYLALIAVTSIMYSLIHLKDLLKASKYYTYTFWIKGPN